MSGMTEKIVLRGRRSWGRAEGEALVTTDCISWFGDINIETGDVIRKRMKIYGKNTKDKILVFPGMKGGTFSAFRIVNAKEFNAAPAAIINSVTNPVILSAARLMGMPIIDRLSKDPLEVIETGDLVVVDGERGVVEVTKKK